MPTSIRQFGISTVIQRLRIQTIAGKRLGASRHDCNINCIHGLETGLGLTPYESVRTESPMIMDRFCLGFSGSTVLYKSLMKDNCSHSIQEHFVHRIGDFPWCAPMCHMSCSTVRNTVPYCTSEVKICIVVWFRSLLAWNGTPVRTVCLLILAVDESRKYRM